MRSTSVWPLAAVDEIPVEGAARRPVKRRAWLRSLSLLITDAVAIAVMPVAVGAADRNVLGVASPEGRTPLTVLVVCFLVALAVSGSYSWSMSEFAPSSFVRIARIWHAFTLGVVLALLVARTPVAVEAGLTLEPEQAVLVALFGLGVIPPARRLTSVLLWPRRAGRRVLILGTGRVAASVAGRLHRCSGVRVVGMVGDEPQNGSRVLGTLADLQVICARHEVDDVVVAFSQTPTHEMLEVLRGLNDTVSIWLVPRLYELVSWRSVIGDLQGIPLLDLPPAQAGAVARAAKRVFDIVGAGLLLLLLAPAFVAISVAIKATSPGPVIYRQVRSGRYGKPFRIYKFRTMREDAEQLRTTLADHNEADGPLFKMRNDPRVTRVGEWLRQTSLDELPQLLNVLRGEMSLVGPRPFPVEESEKITGWASLRFSVPPGLTGLWQVSGRNALSFDDLRHLDYVYAASWSFMWDLRILLQTPASVLHRRGVM